MLPAIYLHTRDGIVRQKELAIISQNLANLSTPGYKKDKIAFSEYSSSVTERIDFSEGDLKPTSNPFDVAISGTENAFFVVKTKDGKQLFTRRGDFFLNKEKKLITRNGFYVQGQKGDITLKGSKFLINRDGEILENGKVIDKLKIVSLPLDKLRRYGKGLFYLEDKGDNKNLSLNSASNYEIFQGYLESSNVKPVEAITKMVSCLRNYEICQKSIQTQSETASKLINDVGIVRI